MNTYKYRQPRAASPGKRWLTTSNTALEEVANKLAGTYNTAERNRELRERKLANTTTSIHFGNDKVNYMSDTHAQQNKKSGYISVDERNAQTARIKAMKKDLTATKFTLGDERPLYESINHEAMAEAEKFRGTARVTTNEEIKKAVKKSSIHFGQEKVDYNSTAHEGMRYQGNENDFSKLKDEVREMTATLRKHNFNFGDEKVSYESDYRAGYGSVPLSAYRGGDERKQKMRATIDDQRACHFQLGNDDPIYKSNTHSALEGVQGRSAEDVARAAQRAKDMKIALQRTSIALGDADDGTAPIDADDRDMRWKTTSASSLEDVAQKLKGTYNTAQKNKELRDRKLANTTTSIHFGNERVNYVSDAHENQKRCSGKISLDERNAQTARIKAMKKDLTATKFTLGDERPLYESINHEAMAEAEKFRGTTRVTTNEEIKKAVKKSSIHFGQEKVDYNSTAHEGMRYQGNENDFSKLKDEVREMTATLRKHNFNFGNEKPSYESDYRAGYGSVPLSAYRGGDERQQKMRATIDDQRACHFNLGNDHPLYKSNTHSALEGVQGRSAEDVARSLAQAKSMKAELQRTSIVIGDDKEYF